MPSSRGCRSSYDCIVKIKGVTTRPILFSQLMRSDGEGAMNPEELFADDRSPASEQERVHEDELHSLMRSILDWTISFLSESSQGTIRAIYFEGKTVKQHSEEEYVTVYAIYKRSTCSKVNDAFSTTYDFPGAVEAVASFVEMRKTPEFDLRDASEMYEKRDCCFEVRSAAYRFRLLELSYGPLYPAAMRVDDGV